MTEIHLRNQAQGKTQPWKKGVTEILTLSGHMISEHTQVAFILPQRKRHKKTRNTLLENLAFLYCSCVNCGLFSKTEQYLFRNKYYLSLRRFSVPGMNTDFWNLMRPTFSSPFVL